MKYELKTLSFGETFSTAFNILLDNFPTLVIITLITSLPATVLSYFNTTQFLGSIDYGDSMALDRLTSFYGSTMLIAIVSLIFSAIQSGLVIKIIASRYLGNAVDLGEVFRQIRPMIGRLILLSLAFGFIFMFGLILFIIPGFIFLLMYYLCTHVMILENKGIADSLKRSQFLTKDYRVKLFGYLVIFGVMNLLLSFISSRMGTAVTSLMGIGTGQLVTSLISYLFGSIVGLFSSCTIVLVYFNLRISKEGFDVEHLATQFAQAGTYEEEI